MLPVMKSHLVEQLKKAEIVKFGLFTLKSGQTTDIYFDMRMVVSHPAIMADICVQLSKLVPATRDLVVAGVPLGGLPYAVLVSQITGLGMIIPRSSVKDHGLQKMVEGRYTPGDEVVLIEDVITTGGSILNSIKDIEGVGLKVRKVIVILDRMAGGTDAIRDKGYNVTSLLTLQDFSSPSPYTPVIKPPVSAGNQVAMRLTDIIRQKHTNLIVSLDLGSAYEVIKTIPLIAQWVCAIKLHSDILGMSYSESEMIRRLARGHDFLIIEDRKFSDIPSISTRQYDSLTLKGDMVTVHGICGEDILREFEKKGVGVLLIHDMSGAGALTDHIYGAKIKDISSRYGCVVGFVGQKQVLPSYLTFTPGIHLESTTDGMGQTYHSVDDMEMGRQVFIVGRGIYESNNIVETTKLYHQACYKKWSL
jgi:uridine monophosphate synthetase